MSPHAYKFMAIPLATRTRNSSKLRAKLGRRRANNTRLFRSIIAAGEYRFRRPVLPRERKRAIIDTAFCLEPPNCFLGFETHSTKSRGGERARDELARVVAGPSKSNSHYTYVYAGNTRRVTRRTKTN